jgi:hypothetical protein
MMITIRADNDPGLASIRNVGAPYNRRTQPRVQRINAIYDGYAHQHDEFKAHIDKQVLQLRTPSIPSLMSTGPLARHMNDRPPPQQPGARCK